MVLEISGKNMINMIICFEDFVQSQAFLCILFCFSFLLIHPCFFTLPPSPFLPSFRYPSITFVLLFHHLIHFTFLSCSLLFRVFHFLCPTQGQGSFCSRGASWMLQTGSTRPRSCCTISRMPAGPGWTSCVDDASWIPASISVTPRQVSRGQNYQLFSQLWVEILTSSW